MESSAKTGKKIFEGHRSTFWIKMPFGIGLPPPTHQLQSTCVGRAQGSQIFKRNSIILIRSKVMAFLVILLSPRGPCCPCHPHIVLMSSLSSSCCPHSPQKVPMWSPWSVVSTCCPCHPHHPHVVPIVPTSSRRYPHHPQLPRYPLQPSPTPLGVGAPNQ